ncbi:polyprenyl synthetase family protein [Ruegeria atlantica]|uniref:polyprenyl synthetase family protein n=1 Tax=Ruegeria atlantica TaxID=81569 RepID=UPI00249494D8|nr:polyprenyl synthetase family protein [Ruegeria atlantica]
MNNEGARADWVIPELGFESETERLRTAIGAWVESTPDELRPQLEEQFLAGSKYFRPLTIFACQTAVGSEEITDETIQAAVTLELFHNMTLVVDDILDQSDERRGKPTMHTAFGQLAALMTSGFMVAEGYRMMATEPQVVGLLSELMSRLGAAEIAQWNSRTMPRGVEDWRKLAQEDTGSMFEVAACLGDRSEGLRHFGGLLGTLYHACDDVSDVRGTEALGGGGEEDIRDGILTLPAAIAVREPAIAEMFRDPNPGNYDALAEAFRAALPEAEAELDRIAASAIAEARRFARNPKKLITLVDRTRALGEAR